MNVSCMTPQSCLSWIFYNPIFHAKLRHLVYQVEHWCKKTQVMELIPGLFHNIYTGWYVYVYKFCSIQFHFVVVYTPSCRSWCKDSGCAIEKMRVRHHALLPLSLISYISIHWKVPFIDWFNHKHIYKTHLKWHNSKTGLLPSKLTHLIQVDVVVHQTTIKWSYIRRPFDATN